jgi:hypothetical protein
MANVDVSETPTGPQMHRQLSTPISPGTYNIRVAVWDGYSERLTHPSAPQPNEQVRVEFRNFVSTTNSSVLQTSNTTSDLRDDWNSVLLEQQVNSNFQINQQVNEVRIQHAAWPQTFTPEKFNSIVPVCIALDSV